MMEQQKTDPWNMPWMETAKSPEEDPVNGFNKDWMVVCDPVEIGAPASMVWDILVDLENYNAWNPFCVRAQSTLEMDAPVFMQLVSQTMPGELQPNVEYVCEIIEGRLLSWGAKWIDEFPYPARRDQIIDETGAESCSYVSSDAFLGEHGWHVMTFCGPWVRRCFNNTAIALKAYAEAKHRGDI